MRAFRHTSPRATPGRPSQAVHGVIPGSTAHLVLLALRGVGGITSEQLTARFGYVAGPLHALKKSGLVMLGNPGQKSIPVRLTELGQELTNADGPLARAKTLNTYCQL